MGKSESEINFYGLGFLVIVMGGFLALIFVYNLSVDIQYAQMSDQAREDLIIQDAWHYKQSQMEIYALGKYFWEIMNIPVPFILVVVLLIAIIPSASKGWRGGKK